MRMRNHAGPSGYDRLIDYIPCDVIMPPVALSLEQRAIAKVLKPLVNAAGSRWYHRDSLIAELNAAMKWCTGHGNVFHFLYGENSYWYLGHLKSLGRRKAIICTYHTPKKKFHQIVENIQSIRRLDGVIVVSTVQRDIFSEIINPQRVFFIPHGIDVGFFKPPEVRGQHDRYRCLFVGTHLRDFDVLVAVTKMLRSKNIEFIVVTAKSEQERFSGLDNVTLLNSIDDNQLLHLYQTSDVLALPMTDSTANNTLLEAMACGLPMLTTDLPAVRDYVDESCAIFCKKGDAQAFADGLIHLCDDDANRLRMSDACQKRVLLYSWERVAEQVLQLYSRVL